MEKLKIFIFGNGEFKMCVFLIKTKYLMVTLLSFNDKNPKEMEDCLLPKTKF